MMTTPQRNQVGLSQSSRARTKRLHCCKMRFDLRLKWHDVSCIIYIGSPRSYIFAARVFYYGLTQVALRQISPDYSTGTGKILQPCNCPRSSEVTWNVSHPQHLNISWRYWTCITSQNRQIESKHTSLYRDRLKNVISRHYHFSI